MNKFQSLHTRFNTFDPMNKTKFTTGRMKVVGSIIYDEHGNPWAARGFNYGHGELGVDGDAAEIASRGFNCVRIIPRWWGTYTGATIDSEDDTTASFALSAYVQTIVLRVLQAKAAGLKVIIAFDSNCGQAERTGDATCDLGVGSPQTFWTNTTQSNDKLTKFKSMVRYYARTLCGLVDFWEPLSEPNPTYTTLSNVQDSVTRFQDDIRNIILQEDPGALFIIGPAPFYENGSLVQWYNPAWASQSNTIYTCDCLDNAVTNTTTLTAVFTALITIRNKYNVPVLIQQLGSTETDDPGAVLLQTALNECNTASGGSISWVIWEWCSASAGSYGPYYGSPGSRTLVSARMAVMQNAATALVTTV